MRPRPGSVRDGSLDPVTASILWARLRAVVDEAAATLIRTSFSTIVREVHDMTQLLTDDEGRTVAQSAVSTPGFVGTTAGGVRRFLELWGPRAWRPGDVAITNDPWVVTGHLPETATDPETAALLRLARADQIAHNHKAGAILSLPRS